jgi:hypothetical protein
MTEIQKQVTYELICGQLAAHIPYDQADAIAQLKVLGHDETLAAVVQSSPDPTKIQRILQRIDEVTND